MEFCTPVVIFLVISAIGLISQLVYIIQNYTTNNMLIFVSGLVGTVLWFMLLNYLCMIDWTGLAWFLVILPIILLIFIMLLIIELVFLGSSISDIFGNSTSTSTSTSTSITNPVH